MEVANCAPEVHIKTQGLCMLYELCFKLIACVPHPY